MNSQQVPLDKIKVLLQLGGVLRSCASDSGEPRQDRKVATVNLESCAADHRGAHFYLGPFVVGSFKNALIFAEQGPNDGSGDNPGFWLVPVFADFLPKAVDPILPHLNHTHGISPRFLKAGNPVLS